MLLTTCLVANGGIVLLLCELRGNSLPSSLPLPLRSLSLSFALLSLFTLPLWRSSLIILTARSAAAIPALLSSAALRSTTQFRLRPSAGLYA